MGLSDEKAQEASERSSRNIDAIVQSSRAYVWASAVIIGSDPFYSARQSIRGAGSATCPRGDPFKS
jgi:hypothetical protein